MPIERNIIPANQDQIEILAPLFIENTMQKGRRTTRGSALKIVGIDRNKTPFTTVLFRMGCVNKGLTSLTGVA